MRKKRNTREAEVMAEKRDDKGRKRGEAGMERERERKGAVSLSFCSQCRLVDLRGALAGCSGGLCGGVCFFLRIEQLAPTLRSRSSDRSKVHLHVK